MEKTVKLAFADWGLVPYAEAWERQTTYFNALVSAKLEGKEYTNCVIL